MIWTAEEKAKIRISKIARKNTALRYLMTPVYILVCFGFFLYKKLKSNTKKLTLILGSVFFGMMYCSFAFPIFIQVDSREYESTETVQFAEENVGSNLESDADMKFGSELDELIMGEYELAELEELEDLGTEADFSDDLMGHSEYFADNFDYYNLEDILDMEFTYSDVKAENKNINSDEEQSFDKEDWKLVLINKQNSIPKDFEIRLGTIKTMKGDRQCDERIIDELLTMITDAKEDGVVLAICSPYRDLQYQERLFNRKIKNYIGRGMSYLEAYQLAGQAVTVPGASEHQIGLALDIVTNSYTSLDAGFANTAAGKWLKENSYKYGFILRYPLGKEYITGIEFEPWHYRYVGVEAATVIMQNEITLEEFWEEYL